MPKRKTKTVTPAKPVPPGGSPGNTGPAGDPGPRLNPLAPMPGDEYHVVLTRSELLILIHTAAGSIQYFCSPRGEGVNTALAIENLGDRIVQLASFLGANRPTLH